MIILLEIIFHNRDPNRSNVNKDFHHHVKCLDQIFLRVEQGDCSIMLTKHVDFWSMWIKECMAEWLRRLTRKAKGQNGRRFKSRAGQLVVVRNSSPGRPEPCEGNLVAAAGSCGGLMVKHPWPLLEISLSQAFAG